MSDDISHAIAEMLERAGELLRATDSAMFADHRFTFIARDEDKPNANLMLSNDSADFQSRMGKALNANVIGSTDITRRIDEATNE